MFETQIIPRVSESDGVGHINNNFVPVWLEAGRREVFQIFTPDLSFDKWRLALVNINIDYTAQIYFHENATVCTWVDRIGNTSFTLYEEIWQTGRICAQGTATYVHFNYTSQLSKPLHDAERDALKSHLRSPEASIK